MVLLKAGWVWRQSSVLRRWKLNWADLWIDGTMVFYKTDSRRDYETRFNVKNSCVDVKVGLECAGVCPPEGHPRADLFLVQLRDGSMVVLSANSGDEALAWKWTIEEARNTPVIAYDPYDDSYQTVPLNCHNTLYATPGSGPHQVCVQRDPYDSVAEQLCLGLLAGTAAGLAMRSFFWMPYWFCC